MAVEQLTSLVATAEAAYARKKAQYESLAQELKYDLAKLDGLRMALDAVQLPVVAAPAPPRIEAVADDEATAHAGGQRRFRLGLQKRIIYQLVANGAETKDEIYERTRSTEIDAKYIREVLREAVSLGDMSGDSDGFLAMTDSGREMLEKAPIPKDWDQYAELFNSKEAHNLFE
jgi:hypothetical protein